MSKLLIDYIYLNIFFTNRRVAHDTFFLTSDAKSAHIRVFRVDAAKEKSFFKTDELP